MDYKKYILQLTGQGMDLPQIYDTLSMSEDQRKEITDDESFMDEVREIQIEKRVDWVTTYNEKVTASEYASDHFNRLKNMTPAFDKKEDENNPVSGELKIHVVRYDEKSEK